jgi:carbamoylphosphate synthase small subunit
MTKNELIANLTVGERFYFVPYTKNIHQVVDRKLEGVVVSSWLGPGLGLDPHETFMSWERLERHAVAGHPVVMVT